MDMNAVDGERVVLEDLGFPTAGKSDFSTDLGDLALREPHLFSPESSLPWEIWKNKKGNCYNVSLYGFDFLQLLCTSVYCSVFYVIYAVVLNF